jgi:hypothetical protein
MSVKFIDGFDQYQGQAGQALLSSLTSAGYTVSTGLAMADGRKPASYALELQVAGGTAGDSWSSRVNNVKQALQGVAVNNAGRYVAVGDAGAAVGSDDGITMLPVVLGVGANMKDIEVSGSTWIAVGAASTILRSTDGKNFAVRPAPAPNVQLNSIATNGGGSWVAVGTVGAVGAIFYSIDDGMSWLAVSTGAGAKGNLCVRFADNVWVAGGITGQLLTSANMADWTARASGATANINAVECSEIGHWLAACGADIRRSIDGGANWALATAAIMTGSIQDLAYADGRWIAVGTSAQVRMTDDEDVWTAASITGLGTTQLNSIFALRGTQKGWVTVGNKNGTVTPSSAQTATIYVSLAPPTRVTKAFKVPGNKFTVGWAHRATARGRILSMTGVVDLDWPAQIEMNGEVGQAIPARNVWYYYELVIDKVNLTATLYINNTLDVTCPIAGWIATAEDFEVTWISENGAITRIDDIYMVDDDNSNGELLLDRLGPIQIPLRLPSADSTPTDWATASGPSHWSQVGMLPPSNESYIRSSTSGAQDLFTSDDPLPDGAGTTVPILAVGVVALAMKGDIDNRQLGLLVGAPGPTQKEITDVVLSVVPEYSYGVFEKAPGNVAWNASNTVSTPFGVAVRP